MHGLVRADGLYVQRSPYESQPTDVQCFMIGGPTSTTKNNMKDYDFTSSGDFWGSPHVLLPNGVGTYDTWGGTAWLYWKEWPNHDSDDTYRGTTTVDAKASVTLTDPPAGASGTISSVEVTIVARRTGGDDQIRILMRVGTSEVSSHATGGVFPSSGATSYAAYTFSRALDPGGGAWDWSDISSLEAGVQGVRVGTTFTEVRVTQLFVKVSGPTEAFVELSTFTNTPATEFAIGSVDIKIKYNVATAPTDDTYKIEYTTGTTWNPLQSSTSNIFDDDALPAVKPWSQVIVEDGSWDWADVGSLRVKFTVTQNGGAWDNTKIFVFEVWATVCPVWDVPPTGSAHMAVIPSGIYQVNALDVMFVDIYVTGVTEMRGFRLLLTFDINVLTADSFFIYDPFQYQPVTPELNNTRGWVYLQQSSTTAQPGFTGKEPVARVYFTISGAGGASELDIIDQAEFEERPGWPFGMGWSKLKDIFAQDIATTMHDGWVSTLRRYLSYQSGILPPGNPPTIPPNNVWHEEYPTFSETWTLTSWEDTQKSGEAGYGELSESDQIDMINSTGWKHWFHVDQVTITIHFTYKLPDSGIGKAEPTTPTTEPLIPGIGSTWHMIYPDYCRTFTIKSHEDTDTDGYIDPSEQFDFTFDDDPGMTPHWAHLDTVTTDIIISQKPIPPEPGVPEFPLGIGVLMSLVALIPVIYVWRTRPQKKVLKR